jgi:predicted dehydrogenase
MVGFNRRFSPMAADLKDALKARSGPLVGTYRVNAGPVPAGHWTLTDEGGGRLKGEACHMLDLFQFLVGSPLASCSVSSVKPSSSARPDENFSIQLNYEDGSLCHVLYTSQGSVDLPKERVELHWNGASAVLEDFRSLQILSSSPKSSTSSQDKGHVASLTCFAESIKKGVSFPVAWPSLLETTQACIELDNEVWGKLPLSCVES